MPVALTQKEPHMRQADLIVVGAGVLGTFHAYFAAQRGYQTLLIERNSFPSSASTRNFGMVPRSIVETDNEWTAYAQDTQQIYRAIHQQHDISVKVTGSLYLASTKNEKTVLQEFAQLYSEQYHCAFLDKQEALSRYTFISESYCTGALLFHDDLTLDPRQMLKKFIPYLTQTLPVEYRPDTNIIAVESSGQYCVVRDTLGNAYMADRVIVCSGADYRTLFPDHFRTSGLQICKLQMMQTVPLPLSYLPHSILSGLSIQRYPAFKSCPSYSHLSEQPVDEEIRAFGIHLLFKQSADGSVIIGDSHEYRDWQEIHSLEESTSSAINAAILTYAKKMLRLPSWNIQKMWNGYYLIHSQQGIYTATIDDRIHFVTGIGGKGMSTGPGYARQSVAKLL
jgi:D-hydroxyproline dehydrogenase subunit beta